MHPECEPPWLHGAPNPYHLPARDHGEVTLLDTRYFKLLARAGSRTTRGGPLDPDLSDVVDRIRALEQAPDERKRLATSGRAR